MKYYIVTSKLADRLGVRNIRFGSTEKGFLVNQSDIAVVGMEKAAENGAREVTEKEAKTFINNL